VDVVRGGATGSAHAEHSGGAHAAASSNHHPPTAYLDLHRALERVPREARVLLALRYVDGLSYGELARIRGISINTVKSQLARGKSLLRAELGKRGADHV
jgi:DNA-directed RNA polymerase specialized sigma24 family protein